MSDMRSIFRGGRAGLVTALAVAVLVAAGQEPEPSELAVREPTGAGLPSHGPDGEPGATPATPVSQADAVTAFVGVTAVPMDEERTLADQTVIVRHGRIADMGPASTVEVPAGAIRIDGRGKYLMPGLTEMHGHTPSGNVAEHVMFLYLANGVTTVRGMLGQEGHLRLRARANSGEILAPSLYLAGPSFRDQTVNSPAEAEQRVRQQVAEGWDLLKIHPGLTRAEYDALALTASELGIRWAGHVPEDVGLRHAIEMGQETFDHLDGYIAYLDAQDKPIDEARLDEIVRLTRDAGAWVVPTMVLWDVGIIGMGDASVMREYPEMRYWPKETIPGVVEGVDGWVRRQSAAAQGRIENPAVAEQWSRNRKRLLKALSDGGVGILMGTDSPQIFSVPGFSLHREMAAMAEAGMTPFQILASGTRNVGEYFQGKDSFGTVAVGRRADLILVNSDPLADVAHVADRAGVMVRGRWLPESEIQERLERIASEFGR